MSRIRTNISPIVESSHHVQAVRQGSNITGRILRWKNGEFTNAKVVRSIGAEQKQDDDGNNCPYRKFINVCAFLVTFIGLVVVGLVIRDKIRVQAGDLQGDIGSTLGSTISLPPSNLDKICDLDEIVTSFGLRENCKHSCEPASCCWDVSPLKSCFIQMEKICAQYSPCGNLIDDPKALEEDIIVDANSRSSDTIVPNPPTQLSSFCKLTDGKADSEGATVADHEKCLLHCKSASCCFEKGQSLSCRSKKQNKNSCHLYEMHCSNLLQSELISDYDGRIPNPPPELPEICAEEMTENDPDAAAECHNLCLPGLCCIGLGLHSNCLFSDEKDCLAYKQHCGTVWSKQIYGSNTHIVPSPVASICSDASAVTLDSLSLCDILCQQGACCWEKGLGNCYDVNAVACAEYVAFCSMSWLEDELNLSPAPPSQPLSDLCSLSNIEHDDGLRECKAACNLGACCFDLKTKENCFDDLGCIDYEVCLQLPSDAWETSHIVPSPIEYICSPGKLLSAEGRASCAQACIAGGCCFAEESRSCYADDPDQCKKYEPCSANILIPPPPADLANVCNLDMEETWSKFACLQACQNAACCWDRQNPCVTVNKVTCENYSKHCLIVEEELNYGIVPDPSLMPVVESCSERSLETDDGIKSCRQQCEPSWCCVAEDPLSCRDSNPLFCHKYTPICGPILNSDVLYEKEYEQAWGENVRVICSVKSIMTIAGRLNCEGICSHAACCYAHDKKYNCENDTADYCKGMEACDILLHLEPASLEVAPSVIVPDAPSNIKDLCSSAALSTFSGRMICDDACKPAECCDLPINQDGCHEGNMAVCESYWPCDALDS